MKEYYVHEAELAPHPNPEERNVDRIPFDCPPCPLCGSAYVSVMAYAGPGAAFLECFLGHCVEVEHGNAEVVAKPRLVMTMAIDWVVVHEGSTENTISYQATGTKP